MKISIIVQNLGVKSGGPSRSVIALAKGLRNAGVDTEIITSNNSENPNIYSGEIVVCLQQNKPRPFGYVCGFIQLLLSSSCSIFHIQGMFSYIPMISPYIARSLHIPYVIAPRGMMYANALKRSSKKKYIFRKLFIDRDLNKAACLHATCIEELQELRSAGITSPIAIIPNSITIPTVLPQIATSDKFRIGFVGRINEIKNIDGLIRAWHHAGMGQRIDAELLIVGGANLDSEKAYQKQLFDLEKELHITNICWAGMKTGRDKDEILRSCTVAVLPSHSENFGMVVPEALINGIPCIASDKTPWQMLEMNHCGWVTPNDPISMANVIKTVSNLSLKEIGEMGLNGQNMVADNFSTEVVSEKLIQLYEWILGKKDKPDFVYTI